MLRARILWVVFTELTGLKIENRTWALLIRNMNGHSERHNGERRISPEASRRATSFSMTITVSYLDSATPDWGQNMSVTDFGDELHH
jgi:hypothetical protein